MPPEGTPAQQQTPVQTQVASPQNEGQQIPAQGLPAEISTIVATQTVDPATVQQQAQQGVQSQSQPATQGQQQQGDLLAYQNSQTFQQLYGQTLARAYAAEQRAKELESRFQAPMGVPTNGQYQQPMMQQQQPPPDPATNPAAYVKYVVDEAMRNQSQMMLSQFRQEQDMRAAAQQEMSWAAAHPQVNIYAIKDFNRANGIADWNLEAGYRLMSAPQMQQQVANQAIAQTFQQVRQQNTAPTAIRQSQTGATPAVGTSIGLSFEKAMAENDRTNGRAFDSWPPEVQQAYTRELFARQKNQ